jgi:hypothetical protein
MTSEANSSGITIPPDCTSNSIGQSHNLGSECKKSHGEETKDSRKVVDATKVTKKGRTDLDHNGEEFSV